MNDYLLGCPWKFVTIVSKWVYNLLEGLTTYLWGYNFIIQLLSTMDIPEAILASVTFLRRGPVGENVTLLLKAVFRGDLQVIRELQKKLTAERITC